MELQKKNQNILKQRWPKIWQTLSQCQLDMNIKLTQNTPSPTLIIQGLHLTSAYDRMQEARLQAQHIADNASDVTVYGFALGDLPRLLLHDKSCAKVSVVIFSQAAMFASLHYFDHSDWLEDTRVTLSFAEDERQLAKTFVVAPVSLRLATDAATRIKDQIKIAINQQHWQIYYTEIQKTIEINIAANFNLIQQDQDVKKLFASQLNSRMVVVAGGPTATEQFSYLQNHRDDYFIIAVSTALQPLAVAEILPDIVIIIDHKQDAIEHFAKLNQQNFQNTPLVYLPAVHRDVIVWWTGPRYVAIQDKPMYGNLNKQGVLRSGGTVTHDAVDLAMKMGAVEITLIGADFCHVNQQSHLQNASSPIDVANNSDYGHAWVINGLGERVPSSEALIAYLRNLEAYISKHPQVKFINTGKAGAKIAGTSWLEG